MIEVIDHLVSHLRTQMAPALNTAQVIKQSIPEYAPQPKFVCVQIYDGELASFPPQNNPRVIIITQDKTDELARTLASAVLAALPEDYGKILPSPVGISPDPGPVNLAQIKPLSIPRPLGDQGNGRFQYSIPYLLQMAV